MQKKSSIWVLLVCAMMATSIFAAAGLVTADGVNAQVSLGEERSGSLSAAGKTDYYYFSLGTGYTSLKAETYDITGTNDFDLYIKRGGYPTTSSYDARAYTTSSVETITLNNPASGTYYVMVRAYSGSGGYKFMATAEGGTTVTAISLDSGFASGSVSGTGDKGYYSVVVPTGKASLRVETFEPTSGYDLDLYVKLGSLPTTSSYDGRGYTSSSAEVVTLTNPASGTYYIMTYSYSGSGNYKVKATSTSSASPPLLSNIAATSITSSGATITWTTNEPATSLVEYGTTTSYGSTATSSTYKTSHSLALTGLNPSTTYYFRVKSTNQDAQTATSSGSSFTTQAAADTTPPVLSSIAVSSITTGGATITWTTNEAATSVVEYGTTTSYGLTSQDTNLRTSHSRTLSGLSAGTKYYFRVKSADAAGNVATSAGSSFTTTASGQTVEAIPLQMGYWSSGHTLTGTSDKMYFSVDVGSGFESLVTLTAPDESPHNADFDLYVKRGTLPTTSSYDGRGYTTGTDETVTINNPAAGTYYIMVNSYSGSGKFKVGSYTTGGTEADTTPPVISNVAHSSITTSGATITWTTDEAATSVVEYGTTTSYGQTATHSTLKTSHSISLTGLSAGTTYYYRVKSADAAGNVATGTGRSFATTSSGDSMTPITLDGSGAPGSVSGTGDKKYYSVVVPSGKDSLKVETYNPTSGYDLDLYVKLGSLPTTSSYDGRGYTSSSAESVTINNPAAGTYYIMAYSYSGSGSFSVKATSTESGGGGDKIALVIGISSYQYISDLSYAHTDALEWRTHLQNQGYTVTALLNTQATQANIETAIANIVSQATTTTKVVITFSGHGGYQSEGGYSTTAGNTYGGQKDGRPSLLFAYDANGNGGGCILDNVISYQLRNLASVETFIFLDCCRSGGLTEMAYRYTASGYDSNSGRYFVAGCQWNQYTYDAPNYGLGAWTYWYLKWAIQDQGKTSMQDAFAIAAPKFTSEYNNEVHPLQVNNYGPSYVL